MANSNSQELAKINNEQVPRYNNDTPLGRFNNFLFDAQVQIFLTDAMKDKKGRFIDNLTTLVCSNLDLKKCTPKSVMYAFMKASSLNLSFSPSLGQAYIIPYEKKKYNPATKKYEKTGVYELQFQIGWRGYMQLALNTVRYR